MTLSVQRTLDAVWRMDSARIIAYLARRLGDVGLAEDMAQESLMVALDKWSSDGLPDNPAAWLMTVAKHRAIDYWRKQQRQQAKWGELVQAQTFLSHPVQDPANLEDTVLDDDILSLIFTACHPVLSPEARCALTLKTVAGLSTPDIARAYLVSESTLAQRIVRAKRTLRQQQVPFALPEAADLTERLAAVLEVIYLLFNAGYTATTGSAWTRPPLCQEAMRLGRMLTGYLPDQGEVFGLLALMEIQGARLPARQNAQGEPILLMDQNRAKWDQLLLNHGFQALARARTLGPAGFYTLQAEIAACHGRARRAEDTDWQAITQAYNQLYELYPSPVIALNRAVAVSRAQGPQAGLVALEPLLTEDSLQQYHLLPSVQGDFLFQLERWRDAADAFEKAASLTHNRQEQALLRERAQAAYAQEHLL